MLTAGRCCASLMIANGSTDVTVYFSLRDRTTGEPDTGVVVANAGLYYVEQRNASGEVSVTPGEVGDPDSVHVDGGMIHVGHGVWRTDWPDAAFDGGVGKIVTLTVVDGDGGAKTETVIVQLSPSVTVDYVEGAGTVSDGKDALRVAVWNAPDDDYNADGTKGDQIDDNAITLAKIDAMLEETFSGSGVYRWTKAALKWAKSTLF